MEETSFYPEINVINVRKFLPLKNRFISGIINVLNFVDENVNNLDYSNVYLTKVVPWCCRSSFLYWSMLSFEDISFEPLFGTL